ALVRAPKKPEPLDRSDRGALELRVRGANDPAFDLGYSAGAGAARRGRSPVREKAMHARFSTVAITHQDSLWVAGTRSRYVVRSGTRRRETIPRSGRVTSQPRSIMIPCANVMPVSTAQAAS